MKKISKNRESFKKRTKNAALGVTVAATLGSTIAADNVIFADTQSSSSEIYSVDNPYRLLIDTLNTDVFKQACEERDSEKISSILEKAGIVTKPTSEEEVAQARMSVAPIVILEVLLVAVVSVVVRDAPEVNVLKNLKVQDSGLRFILNDVYKETQDEAFVQDCYDAILSLRVA